MKGIWIASADCAKSLEDLESERVLTCFVVALKRRTRAEAERG